MVVGIDIGGTKTLVGSFSVQREKPKLLGHKLLITEKDFNTEIEQIVGAIQALSSKNRPTAIVVGSRGEADKQGRITDRKLLGWRQVPLQENLKKTFRCPVSVHNDAALAALAEARIGAGKSFGRVFYCTVSSGIGRGFVVNGRLVIYTSGGGDMVLGRTELDENSRKHTFEQLFSGSAIKQRYGKFGEELKDQDAWDEIARGLALGINNFIVVTQPEVVVIGGGIGQYLERFGPELKRRLERYSTSQFPLPPIKKAGLLEQGVIYGAALLAMEDGKDA